MTREEERKIIEEHVKEHGVTQLPPGGNDFPDISVWSRGRRGRRKKAPEAKKIQKKS